MNNNNLINTENEIFYIYIAISILGLISNDLEKKNKSKFKSTIKFISITNAIVLFIIYIYFIINAYKSYKKKKNTKRILLLISTTLFLIAGLINLYVELRNMKDDEEDALEI